MRRSAATTTTHQVRPVDAAQIAYESYPKLGSFPRNHELADCNLVGIKWSMEWPAM